VIPNSAGEETSEVWKNVEFKPSLAPAVARMSRYLSLCWASFCMKTVRVLNQKACRVSSHWTKTRRPSRMRRCGHVVNIA